MAKLNEKDLENVNGGQKITPRDLDKAVETLLEKNVDPMIQKYKDEMME